MLQNVNTSRIQYLAIAGSIVLFALVVELIRKKRIREEYSLLWILFAFLFLFFSAWRHALEILSRLIGIAYAPATLFLLLIMAMYSILIHFSVVISELTERTTTLVQEVGLLRAKVESLRVTPPLVHALPPEQDPTR